jgi:hypothetical protein
VVDVYIETNLFFRIAEGHDPWAKSFISAPPPPEIRMLIPSVCYMEAFSSFEDISKTYNGRADGMKRFADAARRDVIPGPASKVSSLLDAARLMELKHFNDVQSRFYEAVDNVARYAETIQLDIHVLQRSLTQKLLNKESPTDNLILHVIGEHAQRFGVANRAFVSDNKKDFQDDVDVADYLNNCSICYFRRLQDAIGWGKSVSP